MLVGSGALAERGIERDEYEIRALLTDLCHLHTFHPVSPSASVHTYRNVDWQRHKGFPLHPPLQFAALFGSIAGLSTWPDSPTVWPVRMIFGEPTRAAGIHLARLRR